MSEQSAVCGEGPGGVAQAAHEVVRGGAAGPKLLHRVEGEPLVLAAHRRHRALVLDPDRHLLHSLRALKYIKLYE